MHSRKNDCSLKEKVIEEAPELDPGKRIVWLTSDIDQSSADRIIKCLFALDDNENPINLVISTAGGDLYPTLGIYDVMTQAISSPIRTIGIGRVMSAGVLLLAAGQKGERYISRHCRLMFHMTQGQCEGSTEDLTTSLKEINTLDKTYNKLLKKHSSNEAMVLSQGREKFTTALEAIQMKVCDKYLTKKLFKPPPQQQQTLISVDSLLAALQNEDDDSEDE